MDTQRFYYKREIIVWASSEYQNITFACTCLDTLYLHTLYLRCAPGDHPEHGGAVLRGGGGLPHAHGPHHPRLHRQVPRRPQQLHQLRDLLRVRLPVQGGAGGHRQEDLHHALLPQKGSSVCIIQNIFRHVS